MVATIKGLKTAELSRKSGILYQDALASWMDKNSIPPNARPLEIHINHYSRRSLGSNALRILLVIEPSVTWPKNLKYRPQDYDAVFAAGPIPGSKFLGWFHEPDEFAPSLSAQAMARKLPRYTMVAANKLSLVSGELYSLRRSVALHESDVVDLFGYSWAPGLARNFRTVLGEIGLTVFSGIWPNVSGLSQFGRTPPSYRGESKNKLDPYADNRFAIVIENSLELRTEKLFDAVEAGSIPIYVGPEVPGDVPPSLFLHCDPTMAGVRQGMREALDVDLHDWSQQRSKWLSSESYLKTSLQRFDEFMNSLSR